MVAEGHLVAAEALGLLIERAAAHLGAQRAGILLLADVEDHLLDLGRADGIGHLQRAAQRRDRREVHLLIAHDLHLTPELRVLGRKLVEKLLELLPYLVIVLVRQKTAVNQEPAGARHRG